VEEEWSDQLFILSSGYRSNIEFMNEHLLTHSSVRSLIVTNKGRIPWPIHNQHPVKVGVAWVQKSDEEGQNHYVHVAEDSYPLQKVVYPGDKISVDIALDPRKAPEADEIWIGMVHDGRMWFSERGDAIIKLPNRNKRPEQQLIGLRRKNEQLEKELASLRARNRSSKLNNETHSVHDDDYRSDIRFVNDQSNSRIMEVANRMTLDMVITNRGNLAWNSLDERAVNLGIRWYKKSGRGESSSAVIAEERCPFPFTVFKGVALRMQCSIGERIPAGIYEVWIGPVHEGVAWFSEKGDSVLKFNVTVK
jgi:hypothetical protein